MRKSKDSSETEFSRIASLLASLSNDWEQRSDALRKLQSIFQQESRYEDTNDILLLLAKPLSLQFSDLRAQLVKEAANAVSVMARVFKERFMAAAGNLVVPAMLRVLKSGKGVMFNSACGALVDVVSECASQELLLLFLRACDDKHPSVREQVVKYLAGLLLAPNAQEIASGHEGEVRGVIKRALGDAAMPVRAEARNAFLSFRHAFPGEAEALVLSCDQAMQKKLLTLEHQQQQQQQQHDVRRIWASTGAVGALVTTEGQTVAAATPPKPTVAQAVPTPPLARAHVVATSVAAPQHAGAQEEDARCPFNTPEADGEKRSATATTPLLKAVAASLKDFADESAAQRECEEFRIARQSGDFKTDDLAPSARADEPPPSPKKHVVHVRFAEPLSTIVFVSTPATTRVVKTPASPRKHVHHVTEADVARAKEADVARAKEADFKTPATNHATFKTPASPKKQQIAESKKAKRMARGKAIAKEGDQENVTTAAVVGGKGKALRVSKQQQQQIQQQQQQQEQQQEQQEQQQPQPLCRKETTPIAKRTRRRQNVK